VFISEQLQTWQQHNMRLGPTNLTHNMCLHEKIFPKRKEKNAAAAAAI